MQVQPRHEYKHTISAPDREILRRRLSPLMRHDPHAGPEGRYRIHSLYFDNFQDLALFEKIDGIGIREKFRIRYYNEDLSYIRLEKKCKQNDLCIKYSAPMTADEVRALLRGDTRWMPDSPHELVRELYAKMQTRLLRPRVTVDYDREPFLYPAGNVRITLDRCIAAGPANEKFLTPHASVPADLSGQTVLEVKYDRYLPAHLAVLLQLGDRPGQSYSKYALCRTIY